MHSLSALHLLVHPLYTGDLIRGFNLTSVPAVPPTFPPDQVELMREDLAISHRCASRYLERARRLSWDAFLAVVPFEKREAGGPGLEALDPQILRMISEYEDLHRGFFASLRMILGGRLLVATAWEELEDLTFADRLGREIGQAGVRVNKDVRVNVYGEQLETCVIDVALNVFLGWRLVLPPTIDLALTDAAEWWCDPQSHYSHLKREVIERIRAGELVLNMQAMGGVEEG